MTQLLSLFFLLIIKINLTQMTSRNKDFVQSTLEVLTSSNSYNNRMPNSFNNTHYEYQTQNNQPPFQFEQQCEPSPIVYNDNQQEQNELNYYRSMVHSLNDEIGLIKNKLYTIDSQRSNNEYDNCQCCPNCNRENYDEDNLIQQKDARLLQLEQNRRRLIEKNKELEIQLQQLEQFSSQCKTKTIDNSIYNSFRTGVHKNGKMKPKISNTARLRKTKSVITSNPFNTVLKPSSSFSQKENKIDAIQSKMDAIRKLVINSTEKSHIVKTIKNTESFIVDYVKYLNKTHCIQEEKSNKQIERLTRENKILKEKLSQMKSLIK